jgi:hypothetical protein
MTALEPTEISTGRLHLRPWQPADADVVLAICQDAELQRWTRVPVPSMQEHADHYVPRACPCAATSGRPADVAAGGQARPPWRLYAHSNGRVGR